MSVRRFPAASPAASSRPEPTPMRPIIDERPPCWQCKRALFGFAARPWEIKCQRCNAINARPLEYVANQAELS